MIKDDAVTYGYGAENRHHSAELRRTMSFGADDLTEYIPLVARPAGV